MNDEEIKAIEDKNQDNIDILSACIIKVVSDFICKEHKDSLKEKRDIMNVIDFNIVVLKSLEIAGVAITDSVGRFLKAMKEEEYDSNAKSDLSRPSIN